MKLVVVTVTKKGSELGLKVAGFLRSQGHEVTVLTLPDISTELDGVEPLAGPLSSVMGDLFLHYRGFVMIMAMGIVFRVIAPHIKDKGIDPAVVVMDEEGNFAISTLSGHVGGANDLARQIAGGLNCTAVITTATDVQGVPAVDVIARDYHLIPEPVSAVKKVNAALARGERVLFLSQYPLPIDQNDFLLQRAWDEHLPNYEGWRVLVTGREDIEAGEKDLLLRPLNLVAGVGCKRGTGCTEILDHLQKTLKIAGLSGHCVRALATIEEKTLEKGLVEAAKKLGVPLLGFAAKDLNDAIDQYGLEESNRVKERMGVGGVCEPAAMLACRKGLLMVPKTKGNGITVALAREVSGWWESVPVHTI